MSDDINAARDDIQSFVKLVFPDGIPARSYEMSDTMLEALRRKSSLTISIHPTRAGQISLGQIYQILDEDDDV